VPAPTLALEPSSDCLFSCILLSFSMDYTTNLPRASLTRSLLQSSPSPDAQCGSRSTRRSRSVRRDPTGTLKASARSAVLPSEGT
jgi:hypothetical protein